MPEVCRVANANFLQCHTTSVKSGLSPFCAQKRTTAMVCLKEHLSAGESKQHSTGICSSALEDFAMCKELTLKFKNVKPNSNKINAPTSK